MTNLRYLLLLALLAIPISAQAADLAQPDLLTASLKMIAGLALVLGLILLLYYLFSRKGLGFLPAARNGAIKVIEMRHLMPQKAVCLIEVNGEPMLLALGTDRVELLARLDRKSGGSFAEALQSEVEAGK